MTRKNWRRDYRLNPLKKLRQAKPFVTFDIESQNWKDFRLCGIFDGREYKKYDTIEATCDALFTKRFRNYAIYAHYCGKYDGMFILDELRKRKGWTIEPILSNGRMIEMRVKDADKHRWSVRDSFSILPASLYDLTRKEAFDVVHKKLKADEKGMIENPQYNINDCVGLYEVLEKFRDLNHGSFGLTIARTSLDDYRRNYQRQPFKPVREFERIIREAYYGARTEIFQFNTNPDKTFYDYDVNSLYPFVLRENEYPYGSFKVVHPDIDTFGFSLARVAEQHRFPILPQRLSHKLMFMRGYHTGWYSNHELQLVEKMSPFRLDVLKTIACEEHGPVFRDYVDDIYARRMEAREQGNSALALILKLKLNSFYGKFGQSREAERVVINPEYIEEGMKLDFIGDVPVFRKIVRNMSTHIIPSISALVTAYSRVYMWKWFTGVPDADLFYMDTDSIIASTPCLEESKALGKFKLELRMEKFYPILPKVYYYEVDGVSRVKAKGLPMQDMDSFRRWLARLPVSDHRGIETFKRSLRKTTGETMLYNKVVTRTLASYYDKRRMLDDYRTYPFKTGDDRSENKAAFEKLRLETMKLIA